MTKRLLTVFVLILCLLFHRHIADASISAGNIDDSYAIERVSVSREGKVYAWDRKGDGIAGWPVDVSAEGYKVVHQPRLVDINRDGLEEILLVLRAQGGQEQLRVLKGDGTELSSWRFDFPGGRGGVAWAPIVADVNEDNRLELVFATTDGHVEVYRRSAGYVRLDSFAHDFDSPVKVTAADLKNSGRMRLYAVDEAAGEIATWDTDGTRSTFASVSGAEYKGGVVAMDCDGDGVLELVVGVSTPELIAYNDAGDAVRRYALPSDPAAQPMVADIDLDMEPDIIVLLADRTLYAVHADGSKVRRFDWRLPFEAGDAVDKGIVAFDLYEGLISSVSGWDQTSIYKVSREDFVELTLGENVHVYDRILAEMEMPITRIDEVVVQPKLITPNDDGHNDDAALSYILSDDAQVTIDLFDAAGNSVYRVIENAHQNAGTNSITVDGVNTQGTVTENDDEPLAKGLYFLKVTAVNDLGLASRATTPLIVFGVRAQIDFPSDNDEEDGFYPTVYGTVNVSGIATDPNIGEGNDNFDFQAYKVYYRPGAWEVDEGAALAAGEMGSSWLPVLVPVQHQSPANAANEAADAAYPASNVSVRPVQHGELAFWNTTDAASTPNGVYTILLKVVDGNVNTAQRVNFDSIVVNVANLAPGTPFDPNDPSTDPNDPENLGPVLSNVAATPASITAQSPQTSVAYSLANETSNINIAIYKVVGGQVGPVVASFSQGAKAPGSYAFAWNGKDNLNKRVDVGYYRARVTAAAVDGTGGDVATTEDIHMNVATEYNTGLAVLNFALSSSVFDPFNYVTDGNGNDVLAEELTAVYAINRYAKMTVGIYDEDDALVRQLAVDKVDKLGQVSWNGADEHGVVVMPGKTYRVRIKAECIDAGCADVIEDEEDVEVRALSVGGGGVTADIDLLIGEENPDGTTPEEMAGTYYDDDDPLNDFPLNGSADFTWRAYGHGHLRVPFTYAIAASGVEDYYVDDHREVTVTPENVPILAIGDAGSGGFCTVADFRLHPTYANNYQLTFDAGYQITDYGYETSSVPSGIRLNVTSPAGTQELDAPFSRTYPGLGDSVAFSLNLEGKQAGSGGLSAADNQFLRSNCSHAQDLSICNSLGYGRNPDNTNYLMACFDPFTPPPIEMCGSWPEWTSPVGTGPDAFVGPVMCGSLRLWANARKLFPGSPWGPFTTAGSPTWMDSITHPGSLYVGQYTGDTNSGRSGIISSSTTNYTLTFTPTINGQALQNVRSYTGHSWGDINVGGIIRGWLGTAAGPSFAGTFYTDILPDDFETDDDGQLTNNVCTFDGVKYLFNGDHPEGVMDSNVQAQSRRCIMGAVTDINADYFSVESGPFSLYASYPILNHPMLYTFSDVVHVDDWTVDLRYPDGSVNDAFKIYNMVVNSNGTRDVDGDGILESNQNTNDAFRLKLKSNAAPRRYVEIRGAVNGATWELRYFDAKTNTWAKIAEGVGPKNNPLAWWDVSRLNGREYTVLVRAFDDTGSVKSEDTIDVSIGSEVRANEPAVVTSAYRRYAIHFDEYSLCPDGGSYPCASTASELVTITPIPQDTPGLYLPSGINPIGPIVEIKPDNITINPIYQPQLEAYFTREEIDELYSSSPQEVKDYVYGITASDAPVMALYNLKDDGELEQLATINTWDDRGTPGTADDIFRISGLLNHFSRYLVMREDDGYPRLTMTSPATEGIVKGTVTVSGGMSGLSATDSVTALTVKVSAEGETAETIYTTAGESFDFPWQTSGRKGWQEIVATATTHDGFEASASARVYVDNTAPVTQIVVNEQLVEPGQLAVVPLDSEIMLISEDAIDRGGVVTAINYRWDGGAYQQYVDLIDLQGMTPGQHQFSCYAVDDQGNQEQEQTVFITIIDPSQPGVGSAIATELLVGQPSFGDGHQDWVNESTGISIVEAQGSEAVHEIRYRLNDEDYQLYSVPFTLAGFAEGLYEVEYFGMDFYGVPEAVQTRSVVLDTTPPATEVEIAGRVRESGGHHYIDADTQFMCMAEDGGVLPSGLDRIEYTTDGVNWAPYAVPVKVADPGSGAATLSIRSVDRSGNVEASKVFSLRFDADAPSMDLVTAATVFSPNGDGVQDEAAWSVRVSNVFGGEYSAELSIDGAPVAAYAGIAAETQLIWDGLIANAQASDGIHAYEIKVQDARGVEAGAIQGQVTVDTVSPTLAVTGVTNNAGQVLLSYVVDDNVTGSPLPTTLSIFAGDQLIASMHQDTALPPGIAAMTWDGANQYAGKVLDGRYGYKIVARDAAGNASPEQTGELSFDARPPTSRLVILGPSYDDGAVMWVGGNTELALAANDMSGTIDHIDYNTDGGGWSAYAAPFSLAVEGPHTVEHRAVDAVGNLEDPAKSRQLTLDASPPASTLDVDGVQKVIDGKVHWSGTATFVRVPAVDTGVGVAHSKFEIVNPGLVYDASEPIPLGMIGDGEMLGRYWSVDKVGNEEAKREQVFVLHSIPPTLAIELGMPIYKGSAFTYIDEHTPLQVRARSSDEDIVYLHYNVDGGSLVTSSSPGANELASQPFMIADEGIHQLNCMAVDDFENKETRAMSLVVDNEPPSTFIEKSQEVSGQEHLVTPSTLIALRAEDDSSGVKRTEYALDSAAWQQYAGEFNLRGLSQGEHTIHYRSRDNLDHIEAAHSQLVDLLMIDSALARTALPRLLVLVAGATGADFDPATLPEVQELTVLAHEAGWPVAVTATTAEFTSLLRSDAFNVFAVVSKDGVYRFEGTQAIDKLTREIALRVYKGDVLLLAPSALSLAGVAWERMLGELGLGEASPLDAGVDRAFTTPDDAADVPTLVMSDALRNLPSGFVSAYEAGGQAVAGYKSYGKGALFAVGVPLSAWHAAYEAAIAEAGLSVDLKGWKELWEDFLSHVVRPEINVSPGEVVSLRASAATKDIAADVNLTPEVPSRAYFIGLDGTDALSGPVWTAHLAVHEGEEFTYSVRIPFEGDEADFAMAVTTSWAVGLTDNSSVAMKQAIGPDWRAQWETCRSEIGELRNGPQTLDGGAALLDGVLVSWDQANESGDFETRIDAVLDTVGKLSVFDKDDVEKLKANMAELLESLELMTVDLGLSGFSATEIALDSDGDGLPDDIEDEAGTDPFDADSDDDGVKDGAETAALADSDEDGLINALDADSDGDGLLDGLERGVTAAAEDPDGAGPIKCTDEEEGNLSFDSDPLTMTDMTLKDTDGGGLTDDQEDLNLNGKVDPGETDPNNPLDDTNPTDFAGGGGGAGCSFARAVPINGNAAVWYGALLLVVAGTLRRKRKTRTK